MLEKRLQDPKTFDIAREGALEGLLCLEIMNKYDIENQCLFHDRKNVESQVYKLCNKYGYDCHMTHKRINIILSNDYYSHADFEFKHFNNKDDGCIMM